MKSLFLLIFAIIMCSCSANSVDLPKKINQNLTPEEEKVIIHKSTEPPFSGKYWNFNETGTYICKNCKAELYKSTDKFNSNCGWPSFDDEIPNAIKREVDADGRRIEILCNNCGGHLGHVFEGERLTKKNIRHCVNSLSVEFVPAQMQANFEKATFAAGCFWGVEALFKQLNGVVSTKVGYTGGHTINPTYEEICIGNTGHYEAIEVIFDKTIINYKQVVEYFFEIHDATQTNGQGPDIGEQYLSVIFYNDNSQKEISENIIKYLNEKNYKIATKLIQTTVFFPAENYHQDYYTKKGTKPYCHFRRKIF